MPIQGPAGSRWRAISLREAGDDGENYVGAQVARKHGEDKSGTSRATAIAFSVIILTSPRAQVSHSSARRGRRSLCNYHAAANLGDQLDMTSRATKRAGAIRHRYGQHA